MTDTDKELVKRLREFRMGLLRADGDRDLGFRSNITTNASMALADELNTTVDAIERLSEEVERLRLSNNLFIGAQKMMPPSTSN